MSNQIIRGTNGSVGVQKPDGTVWAAISWDKEPCLSRVSTADLHAELLRRRGATFYVLGPEASAEITMQDGAFREVVEVSGPATIVVNID